MSLRQLLSVAKRERSSRIVREVERKKERKKERERENEREIVNMFAGVYACLGSMLKWRGD